eukprot:2443569-Pleurochrysis_carterae.AAC.1
MPPKTPPLPLILTNGLDENKTRSLHHPARLAIPTARLRARFSQQLLDDTGSSKPLAASMNHMACLSHPSCATHLASPPHNLHVCPVYHIRFRQTVFFFWEPTLLIPHIFLYGEGFSLALPQTYIDRLRSPRSSNAYWLSRARLVHDDGKRVDVARARVGSATDRAEELRCHVREGAHHELLEEASSRTRLVPKTRATERDHQSRFDNGPEEANGKDTAKTSLQTLQISPLCSPRRAEEEAGARKGEGAGVGAGERA